MIVQQTKEFANAVKKLPKQHKAAVDSAVNAIIADPSVGEMKVGDLAGIQVYKFRINHQEVLLAYLHDADSIILYLLKLASHENFYRDLKRTEKS